MYWKMVVNTEKRIKISIIKLSDVEIKLEISDDGEGLQQNK